MNYEQIILDIIAPLVTNAERLKIVPMDQDNLYETTYIIYCDEKDIGRLIGKKGVVAEAIGRTSQTIRKWEVGGVIPPTPFKQKGKRLYSKEHIDAIIKCAESSHIMQGSRVSQTAFSKKLYREFQKVNDLFFKEVEENTNGKVK